MRNTLDIDFNPQYFKDKHYFIRIIEKILRMPCLLELWTKPSVSKGIHVFMKCSIKNCDICRLVFDDQERYRKDIQRPKYARNVMFDKKTLINLKSLRNRSKVKIK